jgi:hypothetical protein
MSCAIWAHHPSLPTAPPVITTGHHSCDPYSKVAFGVQGPAFTCCCNRSSGTCKQCTCHPAAVRKHMMFPVHCTQSMVRDVCLGLGSWLGGVLCRHTNAEVLVGAGQVGPHLLGLAFLIVCLCYVISLVFLCMTGVNLPRSDRPLVCGACHSA